MPSIFLSHNAADKPFARRLAARLIESGVVVWFDEVELKIGDSLVDKISEAINQVHYVAAVISSNSIKSTWVQKELSLAMSKEIKNNAIVVLPLLLDDCDIPTSLKDKLYADFRDPNNFERECVKLLQAMGVSAWRESFRWGISIEWTDQGPRIISPDVVISATEANALLNRYIEWFPKFIEQEKVRRGTDDKAIIGEAANILAVIRACYETYNDVPTEEEMQEHSTELSRKIDLFFAFLAELYFKEFIKTGNTPKRGAKRKKKG